MKAEVDYRLAGLEFSKTDWRPLVSYTANLYRVGRELVGTDQTWKRISEIQTSPDAKDRIVADYMGPQYPWYWSAAVLAGLFGTSAWVLHLSVKSLDRLK